MGHIPEDTPGEWIAENFRNCQECKWPVDPKVFEMAGSVPRKANA